MSGEEQEAAQETISKESLLSSLDSLDTSPSRLLLRRQIHHTIDKRHSAQTLSPEEYSQHALTALSALLDTRNAITGKKLSISQEALMREHAQYVTAAYDIGVHAARQAGAEGFARKLSKMGRPGLKA